jgi:hypothetical protein
MFKEMVAFLRKRFRIDNDTDTVYEAVRRCFKVEGGRD